jgi:actin-like ATPase involved in cell morphogenesis
MSLDLCRGGGVAYCLGVDLGTTFVAAARSGHSQVEMVTLGDRSVVMPSAIYAVEDGTVVIGEAAERRAVSSPERVVRQFKRRLGDPTPIRLGAAAHPATELLAMVLRDVLARVTRVEGEPPQRLVLTRPANWGRFRRGVFEEVPNLAGMPDAVTITEPEAAAVHYASAERLDVGQTVAVYDLGGGTFDATVLRKEPSGVHILGTPEGVERLGGIDFDQALYDYVSYSSDGALDDLDLRDPKTAVALARLRQDCVLAKESLSLDAEVLLPVFLPGRQFDVRVTREDFEGLIRAQIENTITALSRTLQSAGVTADELSAVLLVGGSSRIPLVAHMVSEELGRPILVDTHPKYAVALGAATLADQHTSPPARHPAPEAGTATGAGDIHRPARSVRSSLVWVIAAALLIAGLTIFAWPLVVTPTPPPSVQANAPSARALPALLAPPRHVTVPKGDLVTFSRTEPLVMLLKGNSLSAVASDTLAPHWSITLPKAATTLMPAEDSSVCAQTSNTDCIPVNWDTGAIEPPLQLPGPLLASFQVDSTTGGMLDRTGKLTVINAQTRAARSVPAIAVPQGSGRTLIGAGGNRVYIVDNQEALAPTITVVDLETMSLTTRPWPRRIGTTSPPVVLFDLRPSPDGKLLYTGAGQDLQVYETAGMTLQRTIPQHTGFTARLWLSPHGGYLYLITNEGELRVIDTITGKQVSTGHPLTKPSYMAPIDNGRELAVFTAGGYDLFDTSAFAES